MNKGEVAGKENKEGIKVENILQLRLLRLILNTYLSRRGGQSGRRSGVPSTGARVAGNFRPYGKRQTSLPEETNVSSRRDECPIGKGRTLRASENKLLLVRRAETNVQRFGVPMKMFCCACAFLA